MFFFLFFSQIFREKNEREISEFSPPLSSQRWNYTKLYLMTLKIEEKQNRIVIIALLRLRFTNIKPLYDRIETAQTLIKICFINEKMVLNNYLLRESNNLFFC